MLTFLNIVTYIGLGMIIPLILGILGGSSKKGGYFFLVLGIIAALLPMTPIANFLLEKFFLHPELYGETNWNAIIVMAIEFTMVSLAITEAYVMGDTFTKEPFKNLISIVATLLICSAIFYALDNFNETSNHVHVVIDDLMNIR